jgi:hypothetical protein
MISVVINDCVQCVAITFGLLLATALAAWKLGWSNLFETAEQVIGPNGIEPTVAESGLAGNQSSGWGSWGLVSCPFWPTSVARALAMVVGSLLFPDRSPRDSIHAGSEAHHVG